MARPAAPQPEAALSHEGWRLWRCDIVRDRSRASSAFAAPDRVEVFFVVVPVDRQITELVQSDAPGTHWSNLTDGPRRSTGPFFVVRNISAFQVSVFAFGY